MSRLLISAAHTLESPGVVVGDLKEADLTRSILKKAIPYLEKSGIEYKAVPLDLPLMQRIQWINDQGYKEELGDLFIEIHINDGNKRGFEFWYSRSADKENNSQKLADGIMDYLVEKTKFQKQGVHSEHDHELGSLLILNQTDPIAAALELLYIDNTEDQAILKDESKLDDLAKHVVDAISEFIKKNPDIGKNAKPKDKKTNPFGADFFDDDDSDDTNDSPFNFGAKPGAAITPFPSSKPSLPTKAPPVMMDRSEREKMIKDSYVKIMGKDIPQQNLTQYLNMGVSEEELVKKIVDSEDFKKMVEDAKNFKTEKDKATKAEADLLALQSKLTDLETVVNTMQKGIDYKNQKIVEMQLELQKRGIVQPGQYHGATALNAKNDNDFPGLKGKQKKKSSVYDILIRIFNLS